MAIKAVIGDCRALSLVWDMHIVHNQFSLWAPGRGCGKRVRVSAGVRLQGNSVVPVVVTACTRSGQVQDSPSPNMGRGDEHEVSSLPYELLHIDSSQEKDS